MTWTSNTNPNRNSGTVKSFMKTNENGEDRLTITVDDQDNSPRNP